MRAFKINSKAKIYVYPVPVNMGCSFRGLTKLVETSLSHNARDIWERDNASSGNLFVFINKKLNYTKILFWESHGWCIFAKRLPEATFDIDIEDTSTLNLVGMQRLVDVVVQNGKVEKPSKLKKAA